MGFSSHKNLLDNDEWEAGSEKKLLDTLAKNHACYVLITCDEPTDDGNIQVEMSYEGDAVLASYLLQGAQSIIEQNEHDSNY